MRRSFRGSGGGALAFLGLADQTVLANIYLHYVLDLWFDHRFKPAQWGRCRLIR